MAEMKPFLVEIGTEELPPKSLRKLALAFLAQFNILAISQALQDERIATKNEVFFSPRRLAIYVPALRTRQPDRHEDRLGPAITTAFGEDGKPAKAAEGFAKSCGVTVSQLKRSLTDKGERLVYRVPIKGKAAATILPETVRATLAKLPIPKRMRWGAGEAQFVRPVHWVVMLLGNEVIRCEILGAPADNKTHGHRFHHPAAIVIRGPADYRKTLATTGRVLVEDQYGSLKAKIRGLVEKAAVKVHGRAQLDDALLEEVASLVEWPVPVTASFDRKFLVLPDEVIVAVLESQQRYFPLRGQDGKLLPHFITLSNIKSKKPGEVRRGNERVIVPRLTDAMFFWNTDRSRPLDNRVDELDRIIFQKELGSVGDKSRRVAELATRIAREIGGDPRLAERAARLAKCDLLTGMVGEFPELQGSMGGYYAQRDGEPAEVAVAIAEHYQPRFAGDILPRTRTGQALAIADKLDTIAGIFSIGQKPTGDKDPFGLRRAALGLLRIIIECDLDLDLVELVRASLAEQTLRNGTALVTEIFEFLLERLRAYYLETGIRADVFEAVRGKQPQRPLDFHRRIQAVNAFLALPEAASLAGASKRIANILRQAGGHRQTEIDATQLTLVAEKDLHKKILALQQDTAPLLKKGDYAGVLQHLAALRAPVDKFFDDVRVMDEDETLRANRLALLASLSTLFMHTADLSLIQVDP